MEHLINKKLRTAHKYFLDHGYSAYDCYESNGEKIAEYYMTCAGITIENIKVHFNNNMRVTAIECVKA